MLLEVVDISSFPAINHLKRLNNNLSVFFNLTTSVQLRELYCVAVRCWHTWHTLSEVANPDNGRDRVTNNAAPLEMPKMIGPFFCVFFLSLLGVTIKKSYKTQGFVTYG